MNWDQIKGNWNEYSGKVREHWGRLTDDDLQVVQGHRDELIGRIQKSYGVGKEEAEKQVSEWERSL